MNTSSSEPTVPAAERAAIRERGKAMRLDADEYQKALGEELRELRNRRGWTRKELGEHLESEISLQTLATYELGTRHCSVVRLVELCMAMGEQPQDVLERVQRRLFPERPGEVRASLATLAAVDDPDLAPLRRWAQGRLRQTGANAEVPASEAMLLDSHALGWLAELCGTDSETLARRLRSLSGES